MATAPSDAANSIPVKSTKIRETKYTAQKPQAIHRSDSGTLEKGG